MDLAILIGIAIRIFVKACCMLSKFQCLMLVNE